LDGARENLGMQVDGVGRTRVEREAQRSRGSERRGGSVCVCGLSPIFFEEIERTRECHGVEKEQVQTTLSLALSQGKTQIPFYYEGALISLSLSQGKTQIPFYYEAPSDGAQDLSESWLPGLMWQDEVCARACFCGRMSRLICVGCREGELSHAACV
jgi:hypothetical protein